LRRVYREHLRITVSGNITERKTHCPVEEKKVISSPVPARRSIYLWSMIKGDFGPRW
jgi:hypothetical protein